VTDPVTPPPELVQQWNNEAIEQWAEKDPPRLDLFIATRAAQWGADQELEGCCEWMNCQLGTGWGHGTKLRAARRPKPPSLKERALHELADVYNRDEIDDSAYDTIRRALEALPND
jgi:hypothetical protein